MSVSYVWLAESDTFLEKNKKYFVAVVAICLLETIKKLILKKMIFVENFLKINFLL